MSNYKLLFTCIFACFISQILSRKSENPCKHYEVLGPTGTICYPCPEAGKCNGGKSVICDEGTEFEENDIGGKCVGTSMESKSSDPAMSSSSGSSQVAPDAPPNTYAIDANLDNGAVQDLGKVEK